MKVFKKDVVTRQDVTSLNQAVVSIRVNLYSDGQNPNEAFAQPAIVEIALYKDKEAIVNQKGRLETQTYIIPDVSQLSSYPALVQELIGLMISDTGSPENGATVEDTLENT